MQRYQELSIIYDHSQIPVVLAKNTATAEMLALQRIPLSDNTSNNSSSEGENAVKKAPPMKQLLERFPFIEEWAQLPRHPALLMLREVIVEGTELFLVSERFSETLVRFARRQGVVARTQIRNHALHTTGDAKHDRAAGALLERWQSEDCVPDDSDVELREALGLRGDVAPFSSPQASGWFVAGSSGRIRRENTATGNSNMNEQHAPGTPTIPGVATATSRRQSIIPGGSTFRRTASKMILNAAQGHAIQRTASNVDVTAGVSHVFGMQHRSDCFDPFGASAFGGMMVKQNTATYSDASSQDDLSHHHSSGFGYGSTVVVENGGVDGVDFDVVADHHPVVRFADIYRLPFTDQQVKLVLYQVFSALKDLHESPDRATAHGCIAPKHLVLAEKGRLDTIRLFNFRNLRRAATATSTAVGTPLKDAIHTAIQDSLTQIQEEEEWRKRRKSLYTGAGGAGVAATSSPLSPSSSSALTAGTGKRGSAGDTSATTKTTRQPLIRKGSFEHFRRRGSTAPTLHATSATLAAAAPPAAALIGKQMMSTWNNDDQEALLCAEACPELFNTDVYQREDVIRWMESVYAAPELILEYIPEPTPSGDVWSAALVAAELYCARPLVYGSSSRDCFFRAAALCGCPSLVTDPDFHRWALHVTRTQLPALGIRATPLRSLLPLACPEAVDLLEKCLVLDPAKRLTAAQALEHPFFK